jgi:predicted nucleotidyltransferase component of viral defense system
MINLQEWVEEEEQPERRRFRQAVQLILRAIAESPILSPVMIMKGGVLLAIRYKSSRFTKDIDFSTCQAFQDVDIDTLLTAFNDALTPVSADNEHALALRLQSHEVRPPNNPAATFPTLKMRVGYANRLEARSLRRLESTGSAQIVEIDYSFNEWASDIETVNIDGGHLLMYPFHDLIAEKLRSVLQQPIRRRARYQDIYDLYLLLETVASFDDDDRRMILEKLLQASRDRGIPANKLSMRNESVVELSRKQYSTELPSLLTSQPPDFDAAYTAVRTFFESLPWPAGE